MTSTKIINVLKDDTFGEILELCKATPAEEVILILPKKSKFLSSEDHFAALSAEAKSQDKRISIMSSSADTATLARRYGFEVLAGGGATSTAKPPTATLAVVSDDKDGEEIHEDDIDAYERDVIVPSDEQIGIIHDEEKDELDGVHVEDADGNIVVEEKEEELEDDVEEVSKEKEIEDDEIEGERNDADEEFSVGNYGADGISSDSQSDYRIALAAARMDGIVTPGGRADRLKVKQIGEKPVQLDVRATTAQDEKFRDIEQVWQSEASLAGGDTKKSFWSNFPTRGILAAKPAGRSTGRSTSVRESKRRWSPKIVAGFAIIFVAAAGILFYVASGSAKVTVHPTKQSLDERMKVSLSDTFSSVDPTFIKIPGQLFSIDKSVSQDFPATGEKETVQKARGKLTVYNTFGSAPQTLIATTRFEANGLIFHTLRTVTVPGMNGTKSGSVEVEVIADKAGDSYNITATKFTIPAFKEKGDTQRYEKFYGESTESMRGGVSGLAKIVTEADYAKAKDAITKKLADETQAALQSQAGGLTLVDAGGASAAEITTTANIDQAADIFTVTAQGKLKMMGYKKEDLQDLIKQYIDKKYKLTVFPDKLTVTVEKIGFDDAKGILELRVSMVGDGYGQVDKDTILNDITGKNEQQIRTYFESVDGIGKTTAILPRFRNMPSDPSKIKFEVIYD